MLAQQARPLSDSYWVRPGQLLAGEHPGSTNQEVARQRIRQLLEARVTVYVDLTEEGELESYEAVARREAALCHQPIDYWRLTIADRRIPTEDQMIHILDTIDAAIAAGRTVYVHCLAGIGRTGIVVGCYLGVLFFTISPL